MEVGDARLRYRNQALLFRFLAEVSWHEGFDNVGLDVFSEALPDDGGRDVALAKTGQAGQFLVFLNQRFGLAADFGGRNFDCDFAPRAFFRFRGAHWTPFKIQLFRELSSLQAGGGGAAPHCVNLV